MGGSSTGATGGGGSGGEGFKARLEHYLYSGNKKHVFVGIAIFAAVFSVPWIYMNRGSQHQSHQDYMENASKARNERLSSRQPTIE
ncbi:uncharacterized protein LOC121987907 [Zingiber officinale]|uniref:Transmembrane protein n=1 Tax=Zingiber officinale TaxID=94328 RepID=A0A8J5GLA2_ZINOF|nr:uncharacterized protein LOC121987907 [Zingiber officinale]KAG6505519.1 hypothetical protein ZIOFF_037875 [Zingiber officinale]